MLFWLAKRTHCHVRKVNTLKDIFCLGTMPVSCCVINCVRGFEKGSGITFLRIPDREPKRSAWINAIRRKNWVPSEHGRVCSVHFLLGKIKFCSLLSEKCHNNNYGFEALLFYRYFLSILLFSVSAL